MSSILLYCGDKSCLDVIADTWWFQTTGHPGEKKCFSHNEAEQEEESGNRPLSSLALR